MGSHPRTTISNAFSRSSMLPNRRMVCQQLRNARCIVSPVPEPLPVPECSPPVAANTLVVPFPAANLGHGHGQGHGKGHGQGHGRIPNSTQPTGRKVGGIDFGFRNPFAAVWGVLDRDGVLWLTGEHYEHMRPLSHHMEKIPRDVEWYADPSGAGDITELRCAGFTVLKGRNALRAGIAAVTARLEDSALRVLDGACPNLLFEADLYHYETKREHQKAEQPQDEHNHALAALRYLIAALDYKKSRRKPNPQSGAATPAPNTKPQKPWLRYDNEALWTRIY
jgi:Terminase RNaseH-like domain